MTSHKLIHGDVAKILPTIDTQFDAVIVDPPYNTANKNTKQLKGRKARSSDFGEWDYFTHEEYLAFCTHWIEAIGPLLKESGNLVTFCKLEYISDIIRIYENAGFNHHATIIWHKTNPAPQIRKSGFLSSCEAILWASKGYGDKKIEYTFNFLSQKEMHNFIETPICMGKVRTAHPTQKPKAVIAHLLKIFTNEGDTVLDCFAGSGTTAEACAEAGRNSVSVEIDAEYYAIMKSRVSALQDSLFQPISIEFQE